MSRCTHDHPATCTGLVPQSYFRANLHRNCYRQPTGNTRSPTFVPHGTLPKGAAINPGLSTLAMLLVITPLSNVKCTIRVLVLPYSVSFVIVPLAFVSVPVNVPKDTLTLSDSILPLTFVFTTVWPYLDAVGLLHLVLVEIACIIRA